MWEESVFVEGVALLNGDWLIKEEKLPYVQL